ncbi:MAG: hypothetical protein P4M00_01400 [Azospirillaceae bacterium]|nr:hypothetical protein [Azospirillaceae bacterium]
MGSLFDDAPVLDDEDLIRLFGGSACHFSDEALGFRPNPTGAMPQPPLFLSKWRGIRGLPRAGTGGSPRAESQNENRWFGIEKIVSHGTVEQVSVLGDDPDAFAQRRPRRRSDVLAGDVHDA